MDVTEVPVTREKARELMKAYREHRGAQTPEDRQIERAYREIASGRVLIRAIDSIKQAGLDELGRPKLAIARADHKRVALGIGPREDACFAPMAWSNKFGGRWVMTQHRSMAVPGLRSEQHVRHDWAAVVPLIPVHLRPRAAIENYHVLWEAEWTAQPPVDPMLLRRMTGDLWIVVAAWDLTEVERAAMASRLSS